MGCLLPLWIWLVDAFLLYDEELGCRVHRSLYPNRQRCAMGVRLFGEINMPAYGVQH